MSRWSRRGFLVAGAGVVAGVAGCTGGGKPQGGGSSNSGAPEGQEVTLQWWDHFQALSEVFGKNFAAFEAAHSGVKIERTQTNTNDQGRVLTLAHQSHQMPDVFTPVGLNYPTARLVSDGWMQSVSLTDTDLPALPEDSLFEGLTKFDDKVYSFPMFSPRQYQTTTWYNKSLIDKAGLAPEDFASWDGFRQAARTIKQKIDKASGLILPIKETGWLSSYVGQLATTAGGWFGGNGSLSSSGVDPRTGEYAVDSDAFVAAMEFLLALKTDGVLFPGSESLDVLNSRARWATGTSGFFWDGPWNIGIVKQGLEAFTDQVAVAPIPSSDGKDPVLYTSPPGGVFWLSGDSKNTDLVAELFKTFATEDYYLALAEAMDQPPINLDVVAKSNALPVYKEAIEFYARQVKIAPSAVVRNKAVSDVYASMAEADPDLGHIVQGVLTGQLTDIRKELKGYNDKLSAAREQAIAKVSATGASVSVDDWKFADWVPGQDYTPDKYKQ